VKILNFRFGFRHEPKQYRLDFVKFREEVVLEQAPLVYLDGEKEGNSRSYIPEPLRYLQVH
jgi:hypothetical protein